MSDTKQAIDNIMNSINQDYLDVVYGVNRGLNGLSGGGLDYLGNKIGFDSQMNDYLSLFPQSERLKREKLGSLVEVGGSLLWGGLLPLGKLRVPYNSWQIGRAYDRLKENPFKGSGKDVITKMKNHNGENVLLQRGEAIKGEEGRVITFGKRLKRETGTERNFGLNKAIYKHGMDKKQAMDLPKNIKKTPIETSPRGQDIYRVITEDGEVRVVVSPYEGSKTVSSIHKYNK